MKKGRRWGGECISGSESIPRGGGAFFSKSYDLRSTGRANSLTRTICTHSGDIHTKKTNTHGGGLSGSGI